MQRLSLAALAAGVLGVVAPSQEPVQAPDSPAKLFLADVARDVALQASNTAFQDFIAADGGHWRSEWNYATQTPKAIWGTGHRLSPVAVETENQARTLVQQLLRDQADLLGVGDSILSEEIVAKINKTWVFVMDQSFRGIPVIDGRADVRLVDNGVVSMFGSQLLPIPANFPVVPGIGETRARANAMLHLEIPGFAPRVGQEVLAGRGGSRLVIWADMTARTAQAPNLCWEVEVSGTDNTGAPVLRRAFVDAFSGGVLHTMDDIHNCGFDHGVDDSGFDEAGSRLAMASQLRRPKLGAAPTNDVPYGPSPFAVYSGTVAGWVNTQASATAATTLETMPNLRVSIGGVTGFTDSQGAFSINNSQTGPQNVSFSLAGRRISSITSDGGSVPTASAVITPGTPAAVQFSSPGAGEFERAAMTTYWVTTDVNEFVRSIIVPNPSNLNTIDGIRARVNVNSTCNASYGGNSMNFFRAGGSCNNTAFGDVIAHEWGHGLDDVFGGISNNSGDGLSEGWGDILGTYWSGQPVVGPGFRTNGSGIRNATNTRTYGSCSPVHCAGEVWMGFAWNVRNRLQTTLGAAAGIARAEMIVIGSIVADATNQPAAVREVFIMDDDDGNLINGTPNYGELSLAADARSLPYPVRLLSSLSHTPLASTQQQLTGRLVTADVTALSGAVTRVQVRATSGGSTTLLDMVPTGNPDEFVAVIPGELSPASVNYYFEVTNTGGTGTERFPPTGAYDYKVGAETVQFFDDLESGGVGWTHQQIATQDDWQIGSPTGQSGTSSGVSWQDPTSAFSGNSIWANDLGPNGWNGAYGNNVQNFLQSPTFSTLGATGVTLQFARWLSVEQGIYDTARIEANGTTVWTNPTNSNVLDTGWSIQEIAMPSADNQAAVNLTWRLITDGGLALGGWAIDDVKVFSLSAVPLPEVTMQILPEQALLGAPMSIELTGLPNAPVLVVLGDNPGPTTVPGLPTLSVGGSSPLTVPFFLDATGNLNLPFNAPSTPSASGSFWYAQALSLDVQGQIVLSNPTVNLFQ